MKYEITIVTTSLALLLLSSCAIKEEQNSDDIELKRVTYSSKYQTSPELEQKKVVACVGDQCKATIFANPNPTPQTTIKEARAVVPFKSNRSRIRPTKERIVKGVVRVATPKPTPRVRRARPRVYTYNTYQERRREIKIKRINSKKVAIQVGAFRRYAGARVYARRYGLLSRRYKTVIQKGVKGARPIYRVRILGFRNKQEAREFMYKYNLNDAFLVRR